MIEQLMMTLSKMEMGGDEDFYGFDENKDITSEAEKVYMYALNKITGSGMFPSSS